jgi:hypothetical protein
MLSGTVPIVMATIIKNILQDTWRSSYYYADSEFDFSFKEYQNGRSRPRAVHIIMA